MKIKAIFMDFYGTVVHEEAESMLHICHKIKENSNTDASVMEIGSFWLKEFNDLLMNSRGDKFVKQREVSTISLKTTLTHFASDVNVDELLELMFKHWKSPTIFTDALEFFKHNTIPVYLLSNVDKSDILEAINLLQLKVEGVITSEDVKAYKPYPEMFEYALQQSGRSSDEVIHVGDSLSSDVTGANLTGITSVWVNRDHKKVTGDRKPNYMIEELTEVLKIPALVNI